MHQSTHTVDTSFYDHKTGTWTVGTAVITLSIDIEAIVMKLGSRAAGNKSGKAKFMDGLVTVTTISRA